MCIAATVQRAENHPGLHQVNSAEEDTMVVDTTSKRRASRRRNSASSASSAKRTRTYVEHNYTDHYNDPIYVPGETEEEEVEAPKRRGPRGGVVVPFPERLYTMLKQAEVEGFEDIVSFASHGRCFTVHQPKRFVDEVMPKFFRQSKLTSFQRQVNLYGFRRLTAGADRGAYYHELFLRGRPDLHKKLVRIRVKGTGFKSASSPATEPNFYAYPRCTEDGPKHIQTEESAMETEMPSIVPSGESVSSSTVSTPPMASLQAPVQPSWKPLSAPPKMMVVSPYLKAIDGPTMDFQESENSGKMNEDQKVGHRNSQMTLSSMAKSIALSTSEFEEDPCPITPECNVRHVLSSGLEEALAMVSPVDSPLPSAYPSLLSLDGNEPPARLQAPPLLPQEPEPIDNRMGSFQEGIQALLSSDLQDFDVDHNLLTEHSDLTNEYALDPLFMLDDVVGATE